VIKGLSARIRSRPSIIAIKTRLLRLRLFYFDDTDSAVAAHIGMAEVSAGLGNAKSGKIA